MNNGVIALWSRIFGDNEEFIREFYDGFDTCGNVFGAYRENDGEIRCTSSATGCENENIIGLINRIPMTVRTGGNTYEGKYIFAGCVDPDYRRRGLYRILTERANAAAAFTALIPSEPWLFDLYRRLGYRPMTGTPYPATLPEGVTEHLRLEPYDGNFEQLYGLYTAGDERAFVERYFYKLFNREFINGGCVYYIHNYRGERIGYIIYEKTDENCIKIYDMYCPLGLCDGIISIETALSDQKHEKGLMFGLDGIFGPPLNMLGENEEPLYKMNLL